MEASILCLCLCKRFTTLRLGQLDRKHSSSQSWLTNGYLRQLDDTYADRHWYADCTHASGITQHHAQGSTLFSNTIICLPNLQSDRCDTKVCSTRVRTGFNRKGVRSNPEKGFIYHRALSLLPLPWLCSFCNFPIIPKVLDWTPMPCWASIHVSLSVLLPAPQLYVFGMEWRRGLTQGWQVLWKDSQKCSMKCACWRPNGHGRLAQGWQGLWGDSLHRLALSSGNRK